MDSTLGAYRTCACGRHYSRTGWAELPPVGVWKLETSDFELRNCRCGSTIGVEIPRGERR